MAISPTFALFVYSETHNFQLLFWLAFAVALFGLIVDSTVTLNKVSSSKFQVSSSNHKVPLELRSLSKRESSNLKVQRMPLRLDRFFLKSGWLIGVNMVFFGFCFGVLSNYLAIYGKQVLGMTGGTGAWFMLCSIGLILSRLQGGKALREGKLTQNAAEGMVISLVGYTLFILMPTLSSLFTIHSSLFISECASVFPHIGYYGSALLIGLGNGHLWPAFQNMMISVAHHNERGTANSTILVSWDCGMGLGILVGGIIAELLGYSAAFWTVAIINLAGVTLYFVRTRQFFIVRRLS